MRLPADLCDRLGRRFERELYEVVWAAEPENIDVMVSLGEIYTREGLFERGLEIDQTLVRLCPQECRFHYNLACSHSLLGDLDPAFAALARAVQLGYDNYEHLEQDEDLANLRADTRYSEILHRLRGKEPPSS